MATPPRSQTSRFAFIIGLVSTIAAVGASITWLGARLDRFSLDLHFRWFGDIKPDDRIVLIDIDDTALADMPEWPWPRRRFAQIVSVLDELGAARVGLDLIFSEPTPRRVPEYSLELVGPDGSDGSATLELATSALIDDDAELVRAMQRSGRVYVGAIADVESGLEELGAARGMSNAKADRYTAWLINDFTLSEADLREVCIAEGDSSLPAPGQYDEAKRYAAQILAQRFVDNRPQGDLKVFLGNVLPPVLRDVQSPDMTMLERAWREARAWHAMIGDWNETESITSAHMGYEKVLAPIEEIARAAKGIGLVSYLPDPLDGRLRTAPLCRNVRGCVLPHLGTRIAADVLGVEPCSNARTGDRNGTAHALNVPVDADGQTLINWARPAGARSWLDVFEHIPVTRLLEIALNREAIEENQTRLRIAWGQLIELRHAETIAAYNDYARMVNERLSIQRRAVETSGSVEDNEVQSSALDRQIAAVESDASVWLQRIHNEWQKTSPATEAERAARDQINEFHSALVEGTLARRLDEVNARLSDRNEQLLAELRPLIADRICLVGYTASAQADMVSTPVFDRMPGVMAHANVINMLLQNAFIRRAGVAVNLLIAALAGVLVSWFTSRRGALVSLTLALGVGFALLIGGAAFFRFLDTYVATFGALIAVVVPWSAVTVFRQLTEERARRDFERALSVYTSPAVAARIAGRSNRADLAPQPAEVTCFFSDLQGFTRLSERLGPARTRDVLNPYLEGLARALAGREGLVNKFIGDGVFAFFNAPILPCEGHAEAACAAALEAVRCVASLGAGSNSELHGEPLVVRIGLASGPAFVGDYGSDTKLDYTCIGDTVNVASRLEGLNKAIGTTILVNETCREQAGEAYAFRSIGLVQLAGRAEPVHINELRGVKSAISPRAVLFHETFERLVRAYQTADQALCRDAIAECRDINPEDRVLSLYARAVERLDAAVSLADWRGVLDVSAPI